MVVRLKPKTDIEKLRSTIDTRYDEIKSGKVKPIDGEEAFRKLRAKSDERRLS